jgi:hypothetical protein
MNNNNLNINEHDNLSLLFGEGVESYPMWIILAVQQHLLPNSFLRTVLLDANKIKQGLN